MGKSPNCHYLGDEVLAHPYGRKRYPDVTQRAVIVRLEDGGKGTVRIRYLEGLEEGMEDFLPFSFLEGL